MHYSAETAFYSRAANTEGKVSRMVSLMIFIRRAIRPRDIFPSGQVANALKNSNLVALKPECRDFVTNFRYKFATGLGRSEKDLKLSY